MDVANGLIQELGGVLSLPKHHRKPLGTEQFRTLKAVPPAGGQFGRRKAGLIGRTKPERKALNLLDEVSPIGSVEQEEADRVGRFKALEVAVGGLQIL